MFPVPPSVSSENYLIAITVLDCSLTAVSSSEPYQATPSADKAIRDSARGPRHRNYSSPRKGSPSDTPRPDSSFAPALCIQCNRIRERAVEGCSGWEGSSYKIRAFYRRRKAEEKKGAWVERTCRMYSHSGWCFLDGLLSTAWATVDCQEQASEGRTEPDE